MRAFGERLRGDPRYVVPTFLPALTTPEVLAMEFVEGQPIETLVDAPQDQRDRATTMLIELVLRELFEFGVMQTDPNFGNYRWQPATGTLVLLDFGATRGVPSRTAASYRVLIAAGLAHDRDRIRDIAVKTGFLGADAAFAHRHDDSTASSAQSTIRLASPDPMTLAIARSCRSFVTRFRRSSATGRLGMFPTSRRCSCSARSAGRHCSAQD